MKKLTLFLVLSLSLISNHTLTAQEPILGEVRIFAGNFAPRGWAFCEGQLLSISQNSALFSLIGCTYGGDCRSTFALPDLRGRSAMGIGNGPGLEPIAYGQKGGIDFKTLSQSQLPIHNHLATSSTTGSGSIVHSTDNAVNEVPETGDVPAVANFPGNLGAQRVKAYGPATNLVNGQPINTSSTITVQQAGASQSFDNRHPYLGVRYIIALVGIFPSRS